MARYREDDRVCREAGLVTHDEAQEILQRFVNSHSGMRRIPSLDREHARFSIPANPRRDDDLRLGVYISRQERIENAARCVIEQCAPYGELDKSIMELRNALREP